MAGDKWRTKYRSSQFHSLILHQLPRQVLLVPVPWFNHEHQNQKLKPEPTKQSRKMLRESAI
eukprot:4647481-Prorocentrum_lima.AAC.1